MDYLAIPTIYTRDKTQIYNMTSNDLMTYLKLAPKLRRHCTSDGSTTTTIMTPPGLNQHLKKSKRHKCTLAMFYSTSCPFRYFFYFIDSYSLFVNKFFELYEILKFETYLMILL